MAKGKMRTADELSLMQKNIRRKHRPLLRRIEELRIQERMVDWVMGGDDPFATEDNAPADGVLDTEREEETGEAE